VDERVLQAKKKRGGREVRGGKRYDWPHEWNGKWKQKKNEDEKGVA